MKAKPPQTASGIDVRCAFDELVDVVNINPHPRNPNKHGDRQVALLAKIIRHQGWRSPVVISKRSGFVVAGHGRLQAAQLLQVEKVPVDYQEFATEADEWAHLVADNRIAELAEISEADVAGILKELDGKIDMDLTGFDSAALTELDGFGEEITADAEPQIDKAEELRAKWGVEPGQLWELGDHRLLCGDSTKKEDVDKALGGASPLLMVTDPPYGVDYENKKGAVTNDDRFDWSETYRLFPGAVAYVWHGEKTAIDVGLNLRQCGFEVRVRVVWVKPSLTMGRGHYHFQHEGAWYAVKKGCVSGWKGDSRQSTVWSLDREDAAHPTVKPVECMARPIRNHDSEFVYEPFSGSGTTIIACEQLGRKCRAIEISPAYVAVALQRWADATGKTPKLING